MATKQFDRVFVIILFALQLSCFLVAASESVLPTTIVPVQYDLSVSIDTDILSYSVKELMLLNIQKVSPNISFHASPNFKVNWKRASLTCGQQKLSVEGFSAIGKVETLTFTNEIPIGKCTLDLDVAESMPLKATNGIYVSPNSRNIITQFHPNLTSDVFPCFDDPTFKANFVLSVQHSKKYTALSNMESLSRTCDDETQLCITSFPKSLPMAPSSFGFSLTLDTAQARNVNAINYRVFGPIANKDSAYKWAIDFSSSALELAQKWLNRNYKLQQIDFQSVQNLSTANDNSWGLIKIREPFLNFNASNPLDVPVEVHQKSAQAILDGVLSSWLEHDVTPNGDKAIYLNKGLSTYIQYLLLDQLKPEWKFMDQFVVREVQRSLVNATLALDTDSDLEKATATSASIVRMMASIVGPKVFQSAIQQYLTTSSSTVQPVNLFNAIQSEVNEQEIILPATVQQIFKAWFRARNDVPSIYISRRYDNSSTTRIMHVKAPTSSESLRFIPISFASVSMPVPVPDELVWLSSVEIISHKVNANDSEWLLVSNQATSGYYRVQYDERNWRMLIVQLKGKNYRSILAADRAQLINDAVHFAQYDLLSWDVVFDLLSYLHRERDFIPWQSAKKSLEFFDRMLRSSSAYRHFEVFIQSITTDLYPELSVVNQSEQDHVKRLQRLSISKLACEAGERHCIAEIDEKSQDILSKKLYVVPELQQTIFCAASRHILKPQSKLETALNRYIMSVIQEKDRSDDESMTRAAYGLGCTRNDEIINKALRMSTMDYPPITNIEIRAADRELLFKAIAVGSYNGTRAALIFMRQNYAAMNARFVSLPSVIDTVAPYITSNELSNLLDEFVETNQKRFTAEMTLAVARAKSKAQSNQEWMTRNHDDISKWLLTNIKLGNSAASLTINLALIVVVMLCSVLLRH